MMMLGSSLYRVSLYGLHSSLLYCCPRTADCCCMRAARSRAARGARRWSAVCWLIGGAKWDGDWLRWWMRTDGSTDSRLVFSMANYRSSGNLVTVKAVQRSDSNVIVIVRCLIRSQFAAALLHSVHSAHPADALWSSRRRFVVLSFVCFVSCV